MPINPKKLKDVQKLAEKYVPQVFQPYYNSLDVQTEENNPENSEKQISPNIKILLLKIHLFSFACSDYVIKVNFVFPVKFTFWSLSGFHL